MGVFFNYRLHQYTKTAFHIGKQLVADVIQLMQQVLKLQLIQSDLIACHFYKLYNSLTDPSAVIGSLYIFGKITWFGTEYHKMKELLEQI